MKSNLSLAANCGYYMIWFYVNEKGREREREKERKRESIK